MTFRAIVDEIMRRLPEVMRETEDNYRKCGLDPELGVDIADERLWQFRETPTPAEDRLKHFLMSLTDSEVRKVEVFMYYGRGDDLPESLQANLPQDTKEVTVKGVILGKLPALETYFSNALKQAHSEGLDIEHDF